MTSSEDNPKINAFSWPTSSTISTLAPSMVPSVSAPFSMNFILPVPEASLLAVEICSDTYNQLKANPGMEFYPRTFIFGAKAAAGYRNAKLTIKLINSVADMVNNDASIGGKIKGVSNICVTVIDLHRIISAMIFKTDDLVGGQSEDKCVLLAHF